MISTTPTPYSTALFICWKQNTSQRRQNIIIPCIETEIQLGGMKPLTQDHSAGAAAEPGEEARVPVQIYNASL